MVTHLCCVMWLLKLCSVKVEHLLTGKTVPAQNVTKHVQNAAEVPAMIALHAMAPDSFMAQHVLNHVHQEHSNKTQTTHA